MTAKAEDAKTDRRAFLKLAGLGGVAGGAALAAGRPAEAADEDKRSAGSGYSETDHVKAFYKSARF